MTGLEALLPPPLTLPDGLDRHHPTTDDLRVAMRALAAGAEDVLDSWPDLVEQLVSVGRTDVPVARLVEAHVDALRVHAEAGTCPVPGALYAVWASRSHATGIHGVRRGDGWTLDGTLRFTSGSGIVDRALVPVWTDPETHVLLDLDVTDWEFDGTRWRTRAMAPARSHEITLDRLETEDTRLGADNFYLDRSGFFPGGVGVAAAWVGGASRVLDLTLRAVPVDRRSPAQVVRIGRASADLVAILSVVRETAHRLDAPVDDPRLVATLARAAVAAGVRRILADVRSVVGPAGLAFEEDLTRAVDDLFLFVAQQNEDADALWLGGEA